MNEENTIDDNTVPISDIFGAMAVLPYITMGVTPLGGVSYTIEIETDVYKRDFGTSKVILNNKDCIGEAYTSIQFAEVIFNHIKHNESAEKN